MKLGLAWKLALMMAAGMVAVAVPILGLLVTMWEIGDVWGWEGWRAGRRG